MPAYMHTHAHLCAPHVLCYAGVMEQHETYLLAFSLNQHLYAYSAPATCVFAVCDRLWIVHLYRQEREDILSNVLLIIKKLLRD